MNQEQYSLCLDKYEGRLKITWSQLATQLGYDNGEALRSAFRYEKRRRGNSDSKNYCTVKGFPKVLIMDIETSPLIAYTWGIYDQKILPDNVIKDWMCLSWSAKWLFEGKVFSGVLTPEEVKNEDDSRIMKDIWKYMDEAAVVITHNGNRFDLKRLNTRWLINGLLPPMPAKSIDTLQVARSVF